MYLKKQRKILAFEFNCQRARIIICNNQKIIGEKMSMKKLNHIFFGVSDHPIFTVDALKICKKSAISGTGKRTPTVLIGLFFLLILELTVHIYSS